MIFICNPEIEPKRATEGSAGYDFVMPNDVTIPAYGRVDFDTGVQIRGMPNGVVLLLFIRSSLGKKGISLPNGVAVIDSDYYENIHGMLFNWTDKDITIKKGERYMQGIIMNYFVTEHDEVTEKRKGGIGSTGK